MDKSLFRYIWQHSRRDQLIVCAVVLASLPFYFASLDLPRRIVNEAIQGKAFDRGHATAPFLQIAFDWPSWLGGGTVTLFQGFQVGRIELLFGLSGVFLFFVIINGAFKYWINIAKGVLGERMLRRMRFDLFGLMLRFSPEALRTVKSSETATIVKDEVEPIGGFIGDAFITPVFLGFQALTALLFIVIQNMWLGLMTVLVIGVQFTVIPRLRRELLRLGKQRQLESRRFAGRVSEVLDGLEAVHVHNAANWERAEIGQRLFKLYDLRYRIYQRKFVVKFLNNFLSQLTPFLFYAVGGYLALRGRLDIGQLVAVIGAYRELPPPLKELIDWDQQRLDVQVKYDQVVQHFAPERLLPIEEMTEAGDEVTLLGPVEARDLQVADPHGGLLLDQASFRCDLPASVALIADGTATASLVARILAGRMTGYGGQMVINGHNILELSPADIGRHAAYAGVDPILFPGSIRENLVYGLRHRPLTKTDPKDSREAARRIAEALRTGNPLESIEENWVDYEIAGVADADELDLTILKLLRDVGMGDDIYRFGLSGFVDPDKHPDLAERLVEARVRLREIFQSSGMADLVEPFDPERYNDQATVAENLLFGVPTDPDLTGRNLAEFAPFRETLEKAGLFEDLAAMGLRIAETMTEIFRGLPPGHPLFEQFSFIGADELSVFDAIVRRHASRGRLGRADQIRLLSLPLAYVEPRHRLGLLDDPLKERLVRARQPVRRMLEEAEDPGVDFYDADQVCPAAPLKDNLLFGRVNYRIANAQTRVTEAISTVITELGLRDAVERIGLDHQAGPSGRLLSAQQRASINLARCLVKRPDILVLDGALASFDETRAQQILKVVLDLSEGRGLFFVLPNDRQADLFDTLIRFSGGRVTVEETAKRGRATPPGADREAAAARQTAGGVA
jgi:putative ABC transport system ATP-binding protein